MIPRWLQSDNLSHVGANCEDCVSAFLNLLKIFLVAETQFRQGLVFHHVATRCTHTWPHLKSYSCVLIGSFVRVVIVTITSWVVGEISSHTEDFLLKYLIWLNYQSSFLTQIKKTPRLFPPLIAERQYE